MTASRRPSTLALLIVGLALLNAPTAGAYSVLAHQDTVDAAWDSEIVPLLRARFTGIGEDALLEARAYAYGGSLIQDLGYYPFGSHLFTNLTHYVRTGDFVESLLRGATDANEFAFALGALAHHACDNAGHPMAVNRGVPLLYPKVKAAVGARALYVDAPARHVMVEFAFDVLRVARGGYAAQAYRDRIGFKVSTPALARAVLETYGLKLGDLLLSVDLAVGTYRHAVSTTIPEMTRIAWRDKREEIERQSPGITEQSFVYAYTQADYERDFGTSYRKPGLFARLLALLLKVVPKIGPFKPLAFEPLTPEVEQLFLTSADAARSRYRAALAALRRPGFNLPNTDFDTGDKPTIGANRLADQTYADLLHKLANRKFKEVPTALRRQLHDFFDAGDKASRDRRTATIGGRTRRELDALAALPSTP